MIKQELEITYVDPSTLRPWPGNANQGDVERIKESMRANGIFSPITVQQSTRQIIIGNHRFEALRQLREEGGAWPERVPVVFLDCDNERAGRINVVDNKTRDAAAWDIDALREQLTGFYEDEYGSLEGSGVSDDDYAELMKAPPGGDSILQDMGVVIDAADLQELAESQREEDNSVSTPSRARDDFAVMVSFDSRADRDDLFEQLEGEGYDVRRVG